MRGDFGTATSTPSGWRRARGPSRAPGSSPRARTASARCGRRTRRGGGAVRGARARTASRSPTSKERARTLRRAPDAGTGRFGARKSPAGTWAARRRRSPGTSTTSSRWRDAEATGALAQPRGGRTGVVVCDATSPTPRRVHTVKSSAANGAITCVAVSRDGRVFATGGADATTHAWSMTPVAACARRRREARGASPPPPTKVHRARGGGKPSARSRGAAPGPPRGGDVLRVRRERVAPRHAADGGPFGVHWNQSAGAHVGALVGHDAPVTDVSYSRDGRTFGLRQHGQPRPPLARADGGDDRGARPGRGEPRRDVRAPVAGRGRLGPPRRRERRGVGMGRARGVRVRGAVPADPGLVRAGARASAGGDRGRGGGEGGERRDVGGEPVRVRGAGAQGRGDLRRGVHAPRPRSSPRRARAIPTRTTSLPSVAGAAVDPPGTVDPPGRLRLRPLSLSAAVAARPASASVALWSVRPRTSRAHRGADGAGSAKSPRGGPRRGRWSGR